MGTFVSITQAQFEAVVIPLGFSPVKLDGTHELVYGRIERCGNERFTVRIYSGIEAKTGISRSVGSDAIRTCMVGKNPDGKIFGVCKDRRVNRTKNWATNLKDRLSHFGCDEIKTCNRCNAPMAYSAKKERHYCSQICWTN